MNDPNQTILEPDNAEPDQRRFEWQAGDFEIVEPAEGPPDDELQEGFCKTGQGGGSDNSCSGGQGGPSARGGGKHAASKKEIADSHSRAQTKIKSVPVPSKDDVLKARNELALAREGKARAGGESRGGSAAARRKQRENLFKEWGGSERGYVVCPWTGLKMHWSNDSSINTQGLPTFERGKVFTKCQGGGYQLANLIPESFSANRARNDKRLRKENSVGC